MPLDVLLVVNDINENGARQMPATRPQGYSGPLCDTTGDGLVTALDVLQIINAINDFPDAPTIDVNLSDASDLNGDGVVLSSSIAYVGTSKPNVAVKVERLEGESRTLVIETVASATGTFSIPMQLSEPINHYRFTVSDPRGRVLTTERIVRLGDAVSSWNAAMLDTVRHTTAPSSDIPGLLIKPPPPMVASIWRWFTGPFDAINAVGQQYESYLTVTPQAGASAIVAGAVAAHDVAAEVYDNAEALELWDKTLAEVNGDGTRWHRQDARYSSGPTSGCGYDCRAASDGSQATVPYTPGTQPGKWRPTAPGFLPAALPHWPGVTPFAMTSGDQFRPAAAPALSSAEYAAALNEVKSLGDINSTTRTVDQTQIALFWADGGGTSTPPGIGIRLPSM